MLYYFIVHFNTNLVNVNVIVTILKFSIIVPDHLPKLSFYSKGDILNAIYTKAIYTILLLPMQYCKGMMKL